MGKFDSRVEKGILFGYSSSSKAYNLFNLRFNKIVESINVTFDEIGGRGIKEGKDSMEQDHKEEIKEE
jgi:hypothetical protein